MQFPLLCYDLDGSGGRLIGDLRRLLSPDHDLAGSPARHAFGNTIIGPCTKTGQGRLRNDLGGVRDPMCGSAGEHVRHLGRLTPYAVEV